MKMSFPGKGAKARAPLDHDVLLATLAAQRATRAAAKAAHTPVPPAAEEPITEILLAGPGWQRARSAQRGCFHPDEAERRP